QRDVHRFGHRARTVLGDGGGDDQFGVRANIDDFLIHLRRVVFARYLNELRGRLGLPTSWASTAAVLARAKVPEIQI
ncbi:hypothetical protein GV789_29055, partial [Nocardia cyriacigeorgica]|nr:hypothetical protein [Nocardia cyriacigeorgica]